MKQKMTTDQRSALRQETHRRIKEALREIDNAQHTLSSACALLSTLTHTLPEYRAIQKLVQKVKSHRLHLEHSLLYTAKANKVSLDDHSMAKVLNVINENQTTA